MTVIVQNAVPHDKFAASPAVDPRLRTPLYTALESYVRAGRASFHTPGHAGGQSLQSSPWLRDALDFVGAGIFKADLSMSVKELDSLVEPHGVLREAQEAAARAFGARRTFFCTNGTSTANKIVLQAVLRCGEKVLLDRNCHMSVHHGALLCGAMPVYLDSSVNVRAGTFGTIPRERVLAAIEHHPDARLLVLTSCTYDGLRYDLVPIIRAAHARGIKVLIDEAWYAFGHFHPEFRPTALDCGADYVTQSTHKTLSALSQASMIHVNDPDLDEELFVESLKFHTSSSPSYPILASLDLARMQCEMEGYARLDAVLHLVHDFKRRLEAQTPFRVMGLEELLPEEASGDGVLLDPTKVTVDLSGGGISGSDAVSLLLDRSGIQAEKATHSTLSFLFTIGTSRALADRLLAAFVRLAAEKPCTRPSSFFPRLPRFSSLVRNPRDAHFERGRVVELEDSEDAIAADFIVPKPPGIPVLVPGQRITADILDYIQGMLRTQTAVDVLGLRRRDGRFLMRVAREITSTTTS